MSTYDYFKDASLILCESDDSVTYESVHQMMEDATSPITSKHVENLYNQIITKSHVNFDSIPKSRGNIKAYEGYEPMTQTLLSIRSLMEDSKQTEGMDIIETISTAISNIASLSDLYEKGFDQKNEYVMLEYNSFVYCCVEAVSAVLSQYVEFIKEFGNESFSIRIKNTKYRANHLYIDQLEKFNHVVRGTNYRAYLNSILDGDKNNFVGATTVGALAVAATVAVSIVPITRTIIYTFFKASTKISDALAMQAYFLELNKACVEANQTFDKKKKEKILKKQEAIRTLFMRLSDKLKVDQAKSERDGAREISKDNGKLTVGGTRDQVDSSPYDVLL